MPIECVANESSAVPQCVQNETSMQYIELRIRNAYTATDRFAFVIRVAILGTHL